MLLSTPQKSMFLEITDIILIISGYVIYDYRILLISCILSLYIITTKIKRVQILYLLTIFFSLYMIPPIVYALANFKISSYINYNNEDNIYDVLLCQALYFISFALSLKPNRADDAKKIFNIDRPLGYYICYVTAILMLLLGRSGDSIFEGGGYGKGDVSGSALFEYFFIFVLLAYIYSDGKRIKVLLLTPLFCVYIIKALLYGARIQILELVILIFLIFFQDKIKTWRLLIYVIMTYVLMMIYGAFREDLSLVLDGIFQLLGYDINNHITINNESNVFYSSIIMIAAIKAGVISLEYHLESNLYYIIRFFVPNRLLDSKFVAISYLQQTFTPSGGGGFFSVHLYFHFGLVGTIIGGIFCGYLWNLFLRWKKTSRAVQIMLMLSIIMTPRWFVYSSESILKTPIYASIIYLLINTAVQRKPGLWNKYLIQRRTQLCRENQ